MSRRRSTSKRGPSQAVAPHPGVLGWLERAQHVVDAAALNAQEAGYQTVSAIKRGPTIGGGR